MVPVDAFKRKKDKETVIFPEGKSTMRLHLLPLGRAGEILALHNPEPLHTRLMDLGFVPGEQVEALFAAPSGSPRAYGILGTVIALREKDAAAVEVKLL